jgi:hypothetical protein
MNQAKVTALIKSLDSNSGRKLNKLELHKKVANY